MTNPWVLSVVSALSARRIALRTDGLSRAGSAAHCRIAWHLHMRRVAALFLMSQRPACFAKRLRSLLAHFVSLLSHASTHKTFRPYGFIAGKA